MTTPDEVTLIAEYEQLRRALGELDIQANEIDARLLELEDGLLPDSYTFPGDPPLEDKRKT